MKSYGKDLNDLKNENKELKNRILEIEIEKSSECVIIKNLPPKKTKNKEKIWLSHFTAKISCNREN